MKKIVVVGGDAIVAHALRGAILRVTGNSCDVTLLRGNVEITTATEHDMVILDYWHSGFNLVTALRDSGFAKPIALMSSNIFFLARARAPFDPSGSKIQMLLDLHRPFAALAAEVVALLNQKK